MTNEEMTNEEAVKILKGAIKKPNTKDGYLGQAIDMAIKALEQQPSEDYISRQATISAIQDKYYDNAIGIDIVDMIAHMPAAIPEQLGEHFAEGYKKGIENE